jgi:nucleotide-binding universal stress UspA family protein
MFEKILVPLDGSTYSARAIPYAIAMADKFDSLILLLQVVRPVRPLAPTSPTGTLIASPATNKLLVQQAAEEQTQNIDGVSCYLEYQANLIRGQQLKVSYRVVVGDPSEAIIEFCQKETISLVIMTTTGKSGLKRALLGSVTDRVIREPGFPVLAIRPETNLVKA